MAREAALADARRKAEDIASRTGNTIGNAISVVELFARPPAGMATPVRPEVALSALVIAGSQPQANEMVVRLRVTHSLK